MTKKKKRPVRGRPEKPAKERRSVLLQLRVTESEALQIRRDAEKNDLSVSDWLRELATAK